MAEPHFVFEDITELNVGALGVPGQRTFYLFAGKDASWVRIWLEKEQLQSIATAFEQLLASLPDEEPLTGPDLSLLSASDPPEPPNSEFRIGRIALGYSVARDMVVLVVHREDQEEEQRPAFQFWASKPQMHALSQRIKEVCAAGRPACPLCGGPVDPQGHACPKANGHRSISIELG